MILIFPRHKCVVLAAIKDSLWLLFRGPSSDRPSAFCHLTILNHGFSSHCTVTVWSLTLNCTCILMCIVFSCISVSALISVTTHKFKEGQIIPPPCHHSEPWPENFLPPALYLHFAASLQPDICSCSYLQQTRCSRKAAPYSGENCCSTRLSFLTLFIDCEFLKLLFMLQKIPVYDAVSLLYGKCMNFTEDALWCRVISATQPEIIPNKLQS